MAINSTYNRCFGLGGSARRLHQLTIMGTKLVSTGIQKSSFAQGDSCERSLL